VFQEFILTVDAAATKN